MEFERLHAHCGVRVVRRGFAVAVLATLCAFGAFVLMSCTSDAGEESSGANAVHVISAQEAHDMMTSDKTVVLDVRTHEEFSEGHVCNATLLPLDEIDEASALQAAPDKEEPVLVYCRSGRRSAEASAKLAELGYTRIYDFGGILSWPYDVCSDEADAVEATVENDELPVGVKVVCGKTRSLPEE